MYEWRTGRSCVFNNIVHLVFVTKYRRDVLTMEMLTSLNEIMKETCLQMNCELIEFNGEDDHIHMLVSVHPKHSVSNLVGKLKGKSSYVLRRSYWDEIKGKLWGNHFWSPSYCVVSCGGASLEVVKNYIENQRTPTSEKNAKKSKSLKKS
ncbi:IS200/IS605 family transposase [Acinetobacter indicus]|uniref:IS200/IS605 family transposase n=1 Tax=Acinetobacter indicus TaxID=756892 RepID=UPI0029412397|nr:IS200/IS605 family transposase [Acinetobacter indicus]